MKPMTECRAKKYAMYRGVIKVRLLGTKTPSMGGYLIDIKFSSGVIYACPPNELTEISNEERRS